MISQLFRALPYVSAAGLAAYFMSPRLRRWVMIASCLFFLLLVAVHMVQPQGVSFTKFLLFNTLAVVPVAFLRVFGPLPFLALTGKQPRAQGGSPADARRPSLMLAAFIRECGANMPKSAAIGLGALIAMAALMFFALGAATVGWESTLVSLAFLLPVLKPAQAETADAFDAMMTIPVYFAAFFLAIGGLWLNGAFFHASVAAQSANFQSVWPGYPAADKMFFGVCGFAILFQLISLWKAFRQ